MPTTAKAAAKSSAKSPPKAKSAGAQWVHGKVHWNELNTHDAARAKKFDADSLGWKFEGMPMPGFTYWIIKAGTETVGGIFELKGPEFAGVPEHWMTYISVDDIDARAKKAAAHGGKLVRPAFDIPGVGRIGIIEQPGGGMVGWMTPSSM
jgi:hypothetical protein